MVGTILLAVIFRHRLPLKVLSHMTQDAHAPEFVKKLVDYPFNFFMATNIGLGMPEVDRCHPRGWAWKIYRSRRLMADLSVIAQITALLRAFVAGVLFRGLCHITSWPRALVSRRERDGAHYPPNDVRFFNDRGEVIKDANGCICSPPQEEITFFGGSGPDRQQGRHNAKSRRAALSEYRAAIGGVLGKKYDELPDGSLNGFWDKAGLPHSHAYFYYHSGDTRSQNMGRLAKAYIVENVWPGYYDREALRFAEEVLLPCVAAYLRSHNAQGDIVSGRDWRPWHWWLWRWKMRKRIHASGKLDKAELAKRLRRTWIAQSYGATFSTMVTNALVEYMRGIGYCEEEIQDGLRNIFVLAMSGACRLEARGPSPSVVYVEDMKDYIVFQRNTKGIYPDNAQDASRRVHPQDANYVRLGEDRRMFWIDHTWEETWPGRPLPDPCYGIHDIRLTAANLPGPAVQAIHKALRARDRLPPLDELLGD